MNKYNYSLTLQERTEQEAEQKMKALVVLASRLTTKEITAMAHVVQNDPVKTALAKKYLGM